MPAINNFISLLQFAFKLHLYMWQTTVQYIFYNNLKVILYDLEQQCVKSLLAYNFKIANKKMHYVVVHLMYFFYIVYLNYK